MSVLATNEYAWYELDPNRPKNRGDRVGHQFPYQEDADDEMARIDIALRPLDAP